MVIGSSVRRKCSDSAQVSVEQAAKRKTRTGRESSSRHADTTGFMEMQRTEKRREDGMQTRKTGVVLKG